MNASIKAGCPECGKVSTFTFFKKRGKYVCTECEAEFEDAPKLAVEPQTIFLSYAHKSEREEDFDVSEELVLLIKAELVKDGHTVWIDKEGIRAGGQWREQITTAILEHVHFLSFLSRRSVRDPGVCLNEIATALGSRRNIQTVLTQAEREVAAPLTISHLQWHDFQDWREIRNGTLTGAYGETWDAWFQQRMALVRETVGTAQSARVSGELQRLKDILVPSEFESRIVEKTQGFYGRQWLFDATRSWLEGSSSRMFWLKGSPGIGKSAFAAKLTHQSNSFVIGFFMCDFQGKKDPEESAREAICTLAYQIASRLPDYRKKLIHQQMLNKDKVLKKSADELFEYLLTEPLNKSGKIPEATRLCLVIDGLDEAGRRNHGNALADLLAKHVNRLPEWLGIIVTSRPEPYLEQILKPLSVISVDGQTEQNRLDLMAWIGERLALQLQGEERQRIVDAVIDKSGGTFLYLKLVEEDKTLDFCKPETLPDKLDGIFKQNFNRYFPYPQEYGVKTETFLRLMVAAPGPLPAQMGRQILGWSQRELTLNVIEPLGSLLHERDGGLVFFHASLMEWLKDAKRSGTHCVNDTGGKELGVFLWSQFENFTGSQWKGQIALWLAMLLPHTAHWDIDADLNRAANFLTGQLRHRDSIAVRFRELERIRKAVTSEGIEVAQCTCTLGESLQLIGDSSGALGQFRAEQVIRERMVTQVPSNPDSWEKLGTSYCSLGGILRDQGCLSEAMSEFNNYQSIFEHLVALDPENTNWQTNLAKSYKYRSDIHVDQGDLHSALTDLHMHLAITEQLALQDPDNVYFQRELGVSLYHIGGILRVQGDLAGALAAFRKNVVIMERVSAQDPENSSKKMDLGMSFSRLGGGLEAQGDLGGALIEFNKYRAISEHLVSQDPDNSRLQRELGSSYSRLSSILEAQGDLVGALAELRKSVVIRERLSTHDPDNANWQRDLGVSYYCLGGILEAKGDLAEALAEFGKHLALSERLAAQDPENASWQRDLSVSYSRLGSSLEDKGDLAGALALFRKGLKISERLSALDPHNVIWLSTLNWIYTHLGGILEAQRDLAGAKSEYCKSLVICERIAALNAGNASLQRDLGVSHCRLGSILEAQGDLAGALAQYCKSLVIDEQLASVVPNNLDWLRDLGMTYNRIGRLLEAQGDLVGSLAMFHKNVAICERLTAACS